MTLNECYWLCFKLLQNFIQRVVMLKILQNTQLTSQRVLETSTVNVSSALKNFLHP